MGGWTYIVKGGDDHGTRYTWVVPIELMRSHGPQSITAGSILRSGSICQTRRGIQYSPSYRRMVVLDKRDMNDGVALDADRLIILVVKHSGGAMAD
ncbi:uncharacterized protein N7500_003502 [Penicillium coprophilum]|uniref:uncharacterized protein n=1 Tax=Penicillium coprophilum TaxID=36646 RepID=UPI0023A2D1F2|nr:uncharacterized protein N7500_003502 [Penicillium coprophilum]KAJ5170719.1 hypothetical protein N7500_003502 [Penicillium coprophilum]